MSRLLKQDVAELLSENTGVCVSLYSPMVVAGPEVQQNPIRFKNLLKDAQQQVENADGGKGVTDNLTRLEKLIDDHDFWQHQSEGLAVFVDESRLRVLQLPREFQSRVVAANRFHVTPLLPLIQNDGIFYILAVSQNGCRLFMATRDSIKLVPADLPESLVAVIGTEHHKGFMLHSFKVRQGSSDSAVPHGHFESNDEAELLRYFRAIDEAVTDAIDDPQAPLVFAGVAEHMPIYEQANNHPGLLKHCVHGNPDHSTPEQLHGRAWELVEPHLRKQTEKVLSQVEAARASDLYSDDRKEIADAAKMGRVDTLLMSLAAPESGPADVDHEVEQMVAAVLRNDGSVVIVEPDKVPGSRVAALMRYPAPVTNS